MVFRQFPFKVLFSAVLLFSCVGSLTLHQISDIVLRELQNCGLQTLVLFTDDSEMRAFENELMNRFSKKGIPFFHYIISKDTTINDIITKIKRHTVKQRNRHTTFIVTSPRYNDVMYSSELYSDEAERQTGLMWFHWTRWLIISQSQLEIESYFSSHTTTPLDNIAFTSLDYLSQLSSQNHVTIHTLMWAPNRTRWYQRIRTGDSVSSSCASYPNLQNGLNGRQLTVITKVHWGFLVYIENSPITGQPEYRGFTIDVLETLASAMNFTYVLTPYPDESRQASWNELAHNVTEGLADLSATFWSYSWVDVLNISVTYPVLMDSFTGVYKRKKPSQEYMSLYILCPFSILTYYFLLASLLYTLVIYIVIVGLVYPAENSIKPRNLFSADREERHKVDLSKDVKLPDRRLKITSWAFFSRIRTVFWSLVASVLNQAYLPSPRQMSARLLLFLWSLAMVMFYAVYTGSLTAEMVNSSGLNPVKSFKELASRTDYDWGTTEDSILDKVLHKANSGVLYHLNQRKENVPDGVGGDIYPTLRKEIRNLKENFVFIHFKSLLNQIVGTMDKPEDYFIINDSLLSANQGFIASRRSELGYVLSEYIRKMQDTGMVNKLYEKYAYGNRTPVMEHSNTKNRDPLTFFDIQWPLFIVILLLLLSLTILIVERLWTPVLSLRFRRGK